MISPIVKWDHSEALFVSNFDPVMVYDKRIVSISLKDAKYAYLRGHVIDGKILFPGLGHAFLVWETFAMMLGLHHTKIKVQIDDMKLHRATYLSESTDVNLCVMITKGTGQFEVTENAIAVVSGSIRLLNSSDQLTKIDWPTAEGKTILTSDDIIKIARLKGYKYSEEFNALKELTSDGLSGKILWNNNWIIFMDSMMHIDIVRIRANALGLPRSYRKIIIDPEVHSRIVSNLAVGDQCLISGHSDPCLDVLQAGGVEISGVALKVVNRKRLKNQPTLEGYNFIPHFPTPKLSLAEMSKFCLQVMNESRPMKKMKIVEFDIKDGSEPIVPTFDAAARFIPFVTVEPHYVTTRQVDMDNSSVQVNMDLSFILDCQAVIHSRTNQQFFELIQRICQNSFFLISREMKGNNISDHLPPNFHLIARIPMDDEDIRLIFFNSKEEPRGPVLIEMADFSDFSWIKTLQDAISKQLSVVLFSHSNSSGILGFVNCLLKEPDGSNITCVLITDDSAPRFDLNHLFYSQQMRLGMPINVFKDGTWGTYRHTPLTSTHKPNPEDSFCFLDSTIQGDFSQLTWIEKINYAPRQAIETIDVHYAALNYKDVMIASGKIAPFGLKDSLKSQSYLGLEFSGVVRETGRRVMGVKTTPGAMTNRLKVKNTILWDVDHDMSLEEAATIPVVYLTVYLAFFLETDIRKGKSILIHAGSGGVGLAAIQVALHYGLTVFTTVSADEKTKYLLETFPSLDPANIGNSRDTSFESLVLQRTSGRGVDFVLNSLAGDKLKASFRCLASRGVFLEIGKYDIASGSSISMACFEKGILFKPVLLDDEQTQKLLVS